VEGFVAFPGRAGFRAGAAFAARAGFRAGAAFAARAGFRAGAAAFAFVPAPLAFVPAFPPAALGFIFLKSGMSGTG
jgi:hypothetical protein